MSLDAAQDLEGSSFEPAAIIDVDNSRPEPPLPTSRFDLAERLEEIVTSFESQTVQLGEACVQINQIVDTEGGLSELQRKQLKDRFFESIEQVSTHRVNAISRGQRDTARPDRNPGQTLNRADGREGEIPARTLGITSQENELRYYNNLWWACGNEDNIEQGGFKQARNIEDIHDPHYAWNWGVGGGEAPWSHRPDITNAEKTRVLRTVYNLDIKNAIRSLDAQGCAPAFPANLWQDILGS